MLGVKQAADLNYTCWNVCFQRFCCTACAAVVAASMWSCSTQYSMHWPSHALWWDSSQFWTLTIWMQQGRSQISTRSTVGWVSSRWGSSRFRYWKWHALVTTDNRHPSLCENKGRHRWQQQYDSSVSLFNGVSLGMGLQRPGVWLMIAGVEKEGSPLHSKPAVFLHSI